MYLFCQLVNKIRRKGGGRIFYIKSAGSGWLGWAKRLAKLGENALDGVLQKSRA